MWKDSDGTLGSLKAHGGGLRFNCAAPNLVCGYGSDDVLDALIEKLGEGFVYIGSDIGSKMKCSRCGQTANPYLKAKGS